MHDVGSDLCSIHEDPWLFSLVCLVIVVCTLETKYSSDTGDGKNVKLTACSCIQVSILYKLARAFKSPYSTSHSSALWSSHNYCITTR
jgi:hypothetical protein